MLVRIEVPVGTKGSLNVLMPEAFGDKKYWSPHLYEQRGVRMPEVVQTDFLDAGGRAGFFHLLVKEGLCEREKPFVRGVVIEARGVFLHHGAELVRQRDNALALLRFRFCDNLPALYRLEGL